MEEFVELEFPPKLSQGVDFNRASVLERLTSRSDRKPISLVNYQGYLDSEGRIINEHGLRKDIFQNGLASETRGMIWPLLFGLYPFTSTEREKTVIYADYAAKYLAMKNKWKKHVEKVEGDEGEKVNRPGYLKEIPESQESSPCTPDPQLQQQITFNLVQAQLYADRTTFDITHLVSAIRIIDKDVPRTDRATKYFSGASNIHLRILRNILITYAAFHQDVGYTQGMNDIVSRFLIALDDEVLAFWCLVKYMEHMRADFVEDGMLTKLYLVKQLLSELDNDLLNYLDHLMVSDMTFCHRWMLLTFKREFNEEDSLRCFEVLSSRHLDLSSPEAEKATRQEQSKDFQLRGGTYRVEEAPPTMQYTFEVFMCATILMHYRKDFFQCNETSDVFAFIASLTMNMDLNTLLEKTEALFYSYCKKAAVVDCFELLEAPKSSKLLSGLKSSFTKKPFERGENKIKHS